MYDRIDGYINYENIVIGPQEKVKAFNNVTLEGIEVCGEKPDNNEEAPRDLVVWEECMDGIANKYFDMLTCEFNQKNFKFLVDCLGKAFETQDDSNMKMYVDLCQDAYEEQRQLTWETVLKKQDADPFWVAKKPPPPKVEAPKVEAKPVKKGKKGKPSKVVEKKYLKDTLWFL